MIGFQLGLKTETVIKFYCIQIIYDGKELETDPTQIKEVYNIIVIE